jgi:hypothetical protein
MDCREIKKLLDQYIDNDLSKNASAAVRNHLSACRECGAELALLKKYKKEISSLKEAKAPADFLQQLNQRIDKKSNFKKILKALFFPLKIKLPIEAFGVLASVALFVLLVNPVDQIKESMTVADKIVNMGKSGEVIQKAKVADLERSAKKTGGAEFSLPSQVKDDRMLAKAERKTISVRGEAIKTQEIVLALYQVKTAAASGSLKSIAPSVRSPQSEESDVLNTMDIKKDKAFGAAAEKVQTADSAKSEKIAEAEKQVQVTEADNIQKPGTAKAQDEAINRQLTIPQKVNDIRGIIIRLNGKVIKEKSGRDGYLEYIIVEIPMQSQKEFLDQLSKLGSLQSKERKPVGAGKSDIARFKINIMQME